jgi:hypothetical protein
MPMYDVQTALNNIDQHTLPIMICLMLAVFFAFLYFVIAMRITLKEKVYVVPFIGAALFFWHDFTFVLNYDKWFHVYNHWWLKMWWFALVGTVVFELLMIYYVFKYGHKELMPNISKQAFGALVVLGTLGVGSFWALLKYSMGDELFFCTFAITASFSVPFHTAIMCKRQSRVGQSIVMELATIVMLLSLSAVNLQVAPAFFSSPYYLAFVVCLVIWPLVNIWLMLKLPNTKPAFVD